MFERVESCSCGISISTICHVDMTNLIFFFRLGFTELNATTNADN